MKKILILVSVVMISVSSVFAFDIVPKVTIDLPSTFRTDYEVRTSYGIDVEGRFNISDYFDLGFGVEYLFTRNILNKFDGYYTNKDFNFIPVYATIIWYPLGTTEEYKPYLKVDGGYNVGFNITDSKNSSGGLYISGAIGFEIFDRYILEVTTSRYEAKDNDNDITYKKISFKVGYKFTI